MGALWYGLRLLPGGGGTTWCVCIIEAAGVYIGTTGAQCVECLYLFSVIYFRLSDKSAYQ